MLKCSNLDCGRLQQSGKFCGACGSPLEEVVDQVELDEQSSKEETVTASLDTTKEEEIIAETETVQPVQQQVNVAQAEAAASVPSNPVNQGHQQIDTDEKGQVKKYWEYSVALLKNPGDAFSHKEDKFIYGLINLGLYALTFALIIYAVARRTYKEDFSPYGDMFGIDASGILFQTFLYTFIGIAIMLAVLIGSIFVIEKVIVKQMSIQEIVVQYSGLLMPFIFLQLATFLFAFVGTRFVTFSLLGLTFFFGLYFLAGLFMYEKVTYYQSSPHRVYTAIGTLIFVSIAYTIVMLVIGTSLFESLLEMIDDPFYGF